MLRIGGAFVADGLARPKPACAFASSPNIVVGAGQVGGTVKLISPDTTGALGARPPLVQSTARTRAYLVPGVANDRS